MHLTSARNPLLQDVRRAVTTGRAMDDGRVVIEGPHLVREVSHSAWHLDQILVTPAGRSRHRRLLSKTRSEILEIPARIFESIAGTDTPQEIMALVRPVSANWSDCLSTSGVTVVLDGIQDPGNAGTIVRSAEAFGAASLVFLEGSVRVANGKFLRATAGSIFRLPFLESVLRKDLLTSLHTVQISLFALGARGGNSITETDLRKPCAIAVGNEANGVSAELLARAQVVRIQTSSVESLNAGVACSIVLFEAARQRGKA